MKNLNILLLILLLLNSNAFAQKNKIIFHQLQGVITNYYGEPIANAIVTIQGNNKLYQTYSDSNGIYCVDLLKNGFYDIVCSANGFENQNADILLEQKTNEIYKQNITLDNVYYSTCIFRTIKCPIITESIFSGAYQLKPNQNINSIAAYMRGVDSRNGEIPSINGSRPENTAYYINGVRIAGMGESYVTFIK